MDGSAPAAMILKLQEEVLAKLTDKCTKSNIIYDQPYIPFNPQRVRDTHYRLLEHEEIVRGHKNRVSSIKKHLRKGETPELPNDPAPMELLSLDGTYTPSSAASIPPSFVHGGRVYALCIKFRHYQLLAQNLSAWVNLSEEGSNLDEERLPSSMLPMDFEWRFKKYYKMTIDHIVMEDLEKIRTWCISDGGYQQHLDGPLNILDKPVRKIVCFGLSTMVCNSKKQYPAGMFNLCRRASRLKEDVVRQHVLVWCIAQHYAKFNHSPPEILIETPRWLDPETDKEVREIIFQTKKFAPVTVTEALSMIDSETLVISIKPYIPVRQILANMAPTYMTPRAIVCNEIDMQDTTYSWEGDHDPNSPLVQFMAQQYSISATFRLQPEDRIGRMGVYILPSTGFTPPYATSEDDGEFELMEE